MRIKFDKGCAATLVKKGLMWEGSCTTGTGYNTARFEVQVKEFKSKNIILFKVSEYGDDEFPGFLVAHKR